MSRLFAPGRAWAALVGLWMLASAIVWLLPMTLPTPLLDWQPERASAELWRAFTAAWVHWSALHLGANLLAALVVGLFGYTARLPTRCTLAWLLAWPLTHVALAFKPELLHYGGLSGVLHGGVAIVCAYLLSYGQGRARWIGAGVSLGLLIKLASEEPFGPAARTSAEWDIAVAPFSHLAGALAGLVAFVTVSLAGLLFQYLRKSSA
jgi:rhomboid family GlyGly-CTERM serine protease